MNGIQKKIFIVDDNEASRVACKNILKSHYIVFPLPSADKMFELMEKIIPDMILLDVVMPGMDGYEAGRLLKDNPDWKDIPLLFLSGRNDHASEKEGLEIGALDFIHKPVASGQLLERIKKVF